MSQLAYNSPKPTPIYSFAALKSRQREIKDRASEEIVHITENGNAAFVFCSEDVLAREIARAIHEAIYEREVIKMIERAEDDVDQGRVYHGVEEAMAEVERRAQNG